MELEIIRTNITLYNLEIIHTIISTACYISQNNDYIQNYVNEQLKAILRKDYTCFVSRTSFAFVYFYLNAEEKAHFRCGDYYIVVFY